MTTQQAAVDGAPVHVDHRARIEILIAIMLTLFLSALDQTIVGTALPNATGIVGRLVERGIVARADDATDRRRVLVTLTDAGHRVIGEMEAGRRERMSRLFSQLNEEQQQRLLQSVKDLHAAATRLEAEREDSITA